MLAIWTELAVLTHAPVFLVFCTHAPDGRFALDIEPLGWLRRGEEPIAVADYLKQLEGRIANSPADAVAHLFWPCYEPRPSREPTSMASHFGFHKRASRSRTQVSSRS